MGACLRGTTLLACREVGEVEVEKKKTKKQKKKEKQTQGPPSASASGKDRHDEAHLHYFHLVKKAGQRDAVSMLQETDQGPCKFKHQVLSGETGARHVTRSARYGAFFTRIIYQLHNGTDQARFNTPSALREAYITFRAAFPHLHEPARIDDRFRLEEKEGNEQERGYSVFRLPCMTPTGDEGCQFNPL
ncbi:hypothetical protein MGYG_09183 [Nannizzia gypsea CBS 118893]|uniref:Uncharacterized protein n=1 Tax=Arthroderma gypseum (strain ATCC MYA-4604 / CBS 118893) TaxID=535722 RepID=E4V4W3_ARTGP|nr:hypothetical protein MGYG_09183 [Nannizzia gypsea CBS 118893]EFR05037.1 hypothetical protein MGYG_09183 [Nannizzia gypsea CBS 118893]